MDIRTFGADFKQVVTNEENVSISYEGSIYFNDENALWSYKEPIRKDVFIEDSIVYIVEYDLEQVIVKSLDNKVDIINIIKGAKKVEDGLLLHRLDDKDIYVKLKSDVPQSVYYDDELENRVVVNFSNQRVNEGVDDSLFIIDIPDEFDIIR